MNIVIVGPVGVGKTTVSELLANKLGIESIDFDQYRREKDVTLYKLKKLGLTTHFLDIFADENKDQILDIGGDTVFRSNTDNDSRLREIEQLKNEFNLFIVLLTANQKQLFNRYISVKKRKSEEFAAESIWEDWTNHQEPNWLKCCDEVIDTSLIQADKVVEIIMQKIAPLYK